MKKLGIIAFLVGAVTSSSVFASGIYTHEINAVRDRERVYVADMQMKLTALQIFERRWKMIEDELSSVKSSLDYQVSDKTPAFMPDTPANRLLVRMSGEKTKYEHAAEKLVIAEVSIGHLLNAAAVAVQSAGFDTQSSIMLIHEKNKTATTEAIQAIKTKITTAQAQVKKTLEELMEYQQKALLRSNIDLHKKVLSDLEYSDLFFKMAGVFNSLAEMFNYHCNIKKNPIKAEEYLIGYEWLRSITPLFMGTRIDSDSKRGEYDLLMNSTAGKYAEMLSQFKALKETLDEKAANKPIQKSALKQKFSKSGMRLMYDAESSGGGGQCDTTDTAERETKNDLHIPDNEKESNSCKTDGKLNINGRDYSTNESKNPSTEKFFKVANPEKISQASLVLEFGMPITVEIDRSRKVRDTEAFHNGADLQARNAQDIERKALAKITRSDSSPDIRKNLDPDFKKGLEDRQKDIESKGKSLSECTKHIKQMIDRSMERTSNSEDRASLEVLGTEVNRFEKLQNFFNAQFGNLINSALESPFKSQTVWANFNQAFNVQLAENVYLDPASQEQIQADFEASVKMLGDVALGVVGGVAYDATSLITAVAFDHDLMGNSVDTTDKALLGAAVVMGMIEPAGAKGPALRAIRSALKDGKITQEAASGLKTMAKADASVVKDVLNGSPKVAEGLGQLSKNGYVERVSSDAVNALESGGIPPFLKNKNIVRVTVKESTVNVKQYRLADEINKNGRYISFEHPKLSSSKAEYMSEMGMDMSKNPKIIYERTSRAGDVIDIGPAASVNAWGAKGGKTQGRLIERPVNKDEWVEIDTWE